MCNFVGVQRQVKVGVEQYNLNIYENNSATDYNKTRVYMITTGTIIFGNIISCLTRFRIIRIQLQKENATETQMNTTFFFVRGNDNF